MADIILSRGIIVDGSGRKPYLGDIAIRGEKIAAIGPDPIPSGEVVSCAGKMVCPGFIDTHCHSDLLVFRDPWLKPKLRQGITFEIFGQDGLSAAPVREEDKDDLAQSLAGLNGITPERWSWNSVPEYLEAIEKTQPAVNISYLIPHGPLRRFAMGAKAEKANRKEIQEMSVVLDAALQAGGAGFSTGLIYPPCCYADTRELAELCKVAQRHERPFVVHIRNESARCLEAMDEMATVVEESGVHLHLSHIKIAGRNNWPLFDKFVGKIQRLIDKGYPVTADQYPYIAGSTMFGAILPPFAHDGGSQATVERLRTTADRDRMKKMILEDPSSWENFWSWGGPEGLVISDLPSGDHPEFLGKNVLELAASQKQDPLDFAFDLLRDQKMRVGMISYSQSEKLLEEFFKLPFTNVCTDGLLGGKPHPRTYGAFPRVLARWVRDRKLVTWEQAIYKMSGLPAKSFHIVSRGTLAANHFADIVVFDPEKIQDRADFGSLEFPAGIHKIYVNGALTVDGEQVTDKRRGKVIRLQRARF